ncbi:MULTISPECIES: ABC transporter substrate-binding protein [Paenibacillus]|uniref:ABC transporter substrate-binding protein n=1 Tax=Paenibacillus TaxID=44249 RepID=UPI0007BF8B02|nr:MULTISPECIES: ABC transporter substrate-binding protein [Paenibacillus]MCZ1264202.1 ABC transporter [Paenibacillus tundrae]WDQ33276.1 ABC transporter substrate-binding protein [Paenibacillus marchantiae]SEB18295.1 iron complex transport system substrate-binding protein [Paenibacillus sp. 276b]SHN67817.1 iron complex transport system substrate-binding protein [Paenibacillus sp. ov031]SLK06561.1 iron complex transport system substrate-binding protein [Paenibacillus sp. RU5A]
MFAAKKRFSGLLLMLAIIMILAACNSGTGSGTTEPTAAGSESTTSSTETNTDSSGATRIYKSLSGDVEIPAEPKRIVTDMYVSDLLALGVKPVGSIKYYLENPFYADQVEGIENIGDRGAVSLEKVVALDPDLIITYSDKAEEIESYQKIAPTVVIPYGTFTNVEDEIRGFGELMNKSEEAEAWLKTYDERIEAARAKVKAVIKPEETFSILEVSDKSYYGYGDNFGRGGQAVYRALELTPLEITKKELMGDTQWKEISREVVGDYAGDHIFLTVGENNKNYQGDSIWQSLPAVKNNQVYELQEDRYWYFDPIAIQSQAEEFADMIVERAQQNRK